MIYKIYRLINQALKRIGFGVYLVLFPRDFAQDGLITSRARVFEGDDKFQIAKKKTIHELGVDFEIDWRTHVFLWCLNSTTYLPGKAVELGTGKAWMFTMAINHADFSNLHGVRLIDRFSSFAVDKLSGQPIAGTVHDSYSDNPEQIRSRFFGHTDFEIVQGELPQVLDGLILGQIRFLHIDLNAAEPEVASLRKLWPKLVPGAIVLLDDFGSPEFSQSRLAITELSKELSFSVLGLPTGQGLIVKQVEN